MVDLDSRARSIFCEVLDRASADDRNSYMEKACGPDAELRERVEDLLRAHRDAGNFLGGGSSADGTIDHASIVERPGTAIGNYKLLKQIGEGGFGVVFEAEQERPVRRRVALKVIKPGMDTREVIARFEAERQALALMDHPNIAKVHDAGMTETGRPYFVMELVQGVPITEYCDQCKLTTRERLELFVTVCQAVQHAHQKGVIHRDIKPSNVLVAIQDGQLAPKIIDFGVAKAINQQLTEHTLLTAFAQLVGTPLYMSPEQAELSPLGVDTRSDIYSLGVLLYELLTGTTPFEPDRIKRASFDELRRIIREEEPPRPSARISTLAADLATTNAEHRRTNARRLCQTIRGELDWIVMKCLEKDRSRRYETANALMRDVERYLADDPVEARPASAAYRFRKFYRRNRLAVTAAGLVAASLVVGIAGVTSGLLRARKAETLAQSRFEEAVGERNKAEAAAEAEKRARLNEQKQREYAQAISQFVIDDFLALTSIEGQERFGVLAGHSDVALNKDTTLRELLDRAATKLQQRRDLEPLTEARLCWVIGVNYRGMGEYLQAVDFLERAVELRRQELGDEHEDTIGAENSLAMAYKSAEDPSSALPLFEHVANIAVKRFGPDHQESLSMLDNLACIYCDLERYPEAIALYEKVKDGKILNLGPDHEDTLTTLSNLATAYSEVGRTAEAITLFEQVRNSALKTLGPDHSQTLVTLDNLAGAYLDAGKMSEAIALYEQVKERRIKTLGFEHPDTLSTLQGLAETHRDAGNASQALPLFTQVRDLQVSQFGPDHPATLRTLNGLALTYRDLGRVAEAMELFEQVRDGQARVLPADHEHALNVLDNLAATYREAGRLPEAISLHKSVGQRKLKTLGPDHPSTLTTQNNLALAYLVAGEGNEAVALYEHVRDARIRLLGPDHHETLNVLDGVAAAYRDTGRLAEAVELFERVRDARIQTLGPDHPITLDALEKLAVVYQSAQKLPDAIALFERVHDSRLKLQGPEHRKSLVTRHNLALAYEKMGRLSEAIALYEAVSDAEVRLLGPEHPNTLTTQCNLAGAYSADGKTSDAIALYEQVRDVRAKVLGQKHPDTLTTIVNLAAAHWSIKQFDKAIPLLEAVLKEHEATLGHAHPETMTVTANLGVNYLEDGRIDRAIPLLEDVSRFAKEDPSFGWVRKPLFEAYMAAGRSQDTDPLLIEIFNEVPPQLPKAVNLSEQLASAVAKQFGADHPESIRRLGNLASAHRAAGNLREAVVQFERVRDARLQTLGPDHVDTLLSQQNLAVGYGGVGRQAEGIALLEQVHAAREKVSGPDHPDTLTVLANLAAAYRNAGNPSKAIPLFEQVRDARVQRQESEHPDTLAMIRNLAAAYSDVGRHSEALALLEEVRDAQVRIIGLNHPQTLGTLENLAVQYWSANQLDKSIPLFEFVLKQRREILGRGHPDTLHTATNLGVNYKDAGRLDEAIELFEEALRGAEEYPDLNWVKRPLLEAYLGAGRLQHIGEFLPDVLAEIRQANAPDSSELARELAKLGALLLQGKAYDESVLVLRECLALREKLVSAKDKGVRSWQVASAKSLLGGALVGQAAKAAKGDEKEKLLADAETLLLDGFAGLKLAADLAQTNPAAPDVLPDTSRYLMTDTLDRLIELYSTLEKPNEISKWQTEKSKRLPSAVQEPNHEPIADNIQTEAEIKP
jgi:serine/threonine protein kinase